MRGYQSPAKAKAKSRNHTLGLRDFLGLGSGSSGKIAVKSSSINARKEQSGAHSVLSVPPCNDS